MLFKVSLNILFTLAISMHVVIVPCVLAATKQTTKEHKEHDTVKTTSAPSTSNSVKLESVSIYCFCTGGFIVDSKNQTVCVKDCNGIERLANEVDCTFPFEYNNEWYDTCVSGSDNVYWCSIDSVYSGRFATCKQECPQLALELMTDGTTHTACLPKAEGFVSYPVSDAEIQVILDQHNGIRSNVTVPAADMGALYWDNDLALLAQKLADHGMFNHDEPAARTLLNNRSISVGQNLFSSNGIVYNSETFWKTVVGSWYAEIKYFVYGNGSTTGDWENVGHYTQIINNGTHRVGCGAAGKDKFLLAVCNYASAQYDTSFPYTSGKPCSDCESSLCKNNLCYCDKFCQNYGTLDMATCSCTCQPYATGSNCETLLCNKSDTDYGCWSDDRSDPWVCSYSNIEPLCPHTCGICDYLPATNYTGYY